MHGQLRENHRTFYCPTGHANYYPKGSSPKEQKIDRLEAQVEWRDRQIETRDRQIEELQHTARSLRAQLAWARRRARQHLEEVA